MRKTHASLLFFILCFALFLWMAIEARSFQPQASYFPFYIAILAIVLTILGMLKEIVLIRKGYDEGLFHNNIRSVLRYTGWIVGFIVVIYIAGFVVASFIYLVLFLFFEARIGVVKTILSSGIAVIVIIFVSKLLELKWPSNLLGIF